MSVLLTNGYIHSTSDPYANALHVEGEIIAWTGSDETAESMLKATGAEPVESVDLAGALVTPAWVDAFTSNPVTDQQDPRRAATVITAAEDPNFVYSAAGTSNEQAVGTWVPVEALDELDSIVEGIKAPQQLLIDSADATTMDRILRSLATLPATSLMRSRHRIRFNHPLSADQLAAISKLNLSVTIVADSHEGTPVVHAPTVDLLAEGVHVVAGSGDYRGNFWDIVTALIEHPNTAQRVSTRAAFNPAVRDGFRVLPSVLAQQHMSSGRIAIGSPADLNIWHADQLGVQAPDVSAAHWSTDARAGTPLLPILDSAENAPALKAVVRGGTYIPLDTAEQE